MAAESRSGEPGVLLEELLAMAAAGGVWAALSLGVLVALATWGWFKASRKGSGPSSPDLPSQSGAAATVTADEKGGDLTKVNELGASVPESPVKAVSSCLDDISDIREITGNCSDNLVPVISNEDLCDSEQVCIPLSEDDPKQSQPFKNFMTNSSSIGKDPNHCIGTTEQNSKEEGNYENKNQTEHCQKLHECSVLKDEDLDHKYQSESGCLSNETFDIDNSNDNNSDLPKEPTLLTEMTKDDEEWEILEEPNTLEVETKVSPEIDHAAKKIAAVSPLPLKIIVVKFQVHYVTELESQILAVMGNHEHLGQWENYVPLKPGKDGFWSGSVLLPMNSKIEWKFVMVENGKVRRWEECLNRCLETSHEDIAVHRCWGFQ